MALEDMQSQYGPFNAKGKPGTGEKIDLLAFEKAPENTGVVGAASKYGPQSKPGKPHEWVEMEGGVSIYGGE
tara:strand:+ start:600 stop:815 length:216 start_codon:yes stop_codon:yes gene_type:complete